MDSITSYDSAMHRMSVRHLEVQTLSDDVLGEVISELEDVEPLLPETKTQLKLYTHAEFKGYSPYGIAAYAQTTRESWINAGYMLEQMDLWLSSRSLGACWLGAETPTLGLVPEDMGYVASVCFGVPIGEMHREDISNIKRKPLDMITDIENPSPVLNLARLAPSALNRQPCYFSGTTNDMIVSTTDRLLARKSLTLLDTGIILLYVRIAAEHMGKDCFISLEKPLDVQLPEHHTFQATIRLRDRLEDDNG